MSRIIVMAVAALSMLYVGVQSLSFRSQAVGDLNLSNGSAEAYEFTDTVAGDGVAILGNALPRLFIVVLLLLLVGMLVLTR